LEEEEEAAAVVVEGGAVEGGGVVQGVHIVIAGYLFLYFHTNYYFQL